VVRGADPAADVGARGDRDDPAGAPAIHHASRRRPAREERAAQVGLDRAVPFFDRHVEHRAVWNDSGIGHGDRDEAAQCLLRRGLIRLAAMRQAHRGRCRSPAE
jgi:hypothetical protein